MEVSANTDGEEVVAVAKRSSPSPAREGLASDELQKKQDEVTEKAFRQALAKLPAQTPLEQTSPR